MFLQRIIISEKKNRQLYNYILDLIYDFLISFWCKVYFNEDVLDFYFDHYLPTSVVLRFFYFTVVKFCKINFLWICFVNYIFLFLLF
jgi:hypothetical protein